MSLRGIRLLSIIILYCLISISALSFLIDTYDNDNLIASKQKVTRENSEVHISNINRTEFREWLRFNEGSGNTAYDISGYNNHGTLYGPSWVSGFQSYGLRFDGLNDYLKVEDSQSLHIDNAITVCYWCKFESPQYWSIIMMKGESYSMGDNDWFFFHGGENNIGFGIINEYGQEKSIFSSGVLEYGKWYFIIGKYNQDKVWIRIMNDTYDNSWWAWGGGKIRVSTSNIYMATRARGAYTLVNLDEVQIYNVALSDNEILFLFNQKACMYYSEGILYSKSLIGKVDSFIRFFYNCYKTLEQNIQIQFSNNNNTWYSSEGYLGSWSNLNNGSHALNLTLPYNEKFYYRVSFKRGVNDESPKLYDIYLTYESLTVESTIWQDLIMFLILLFVLIGLGLLGLSVHVFFALLGFLLSIILTVYMVVNGYLLTDYPFPLIYLMLIPILENFLIIVKEAG